MHSIDELEEIVEKSLEKCLHQNKANIMNQWGIENNIDKWTKILETTFVNNAKTNKDTYKRQNFI